MTLTKECPNCEGLGEIEVGHGFQTGDPTVDDWALVDCEDCDGTGVVEDPDHEEDSGVIDVEMFIRDWFAGQAMQGFLASGRIPNPLSVKEDDTIAQFWAREAYMMADAMIAARDQ